MDVPAVADSASAMLAAVAGLSLGWRRVWPGRMAAVSVAACGAAMMLVGPFAPVAGWVAVVAVARHAPRVSTALAAATAAAVGLVAAALAAALVHDRPEPLWPLVQLTALVLVVAVVMRLQAARAQAQRRERAAELELTAAAERLRIARDLHDLVGHGLSMIAVQSSTARLALRAGEADVAGRAIAAVEQASRDAMAEMRQLLGLLRGDPGDGSGGGTAPAPGLAGIEGLLADARAAGWQVTVQQSGPLDTVPPVLGLCAFRVVQEAVTNAVRHAPGAAIVISLDASAGVLSIDVTDDGAVRPEATGGTARYGLIGMRERVIAAGGTFEAGPRGDGPGWRVAARLPLAEGAAT